MTERPTHKKCRGCGEWYSFSKRASLKQKFCSVSCFAEHRNASPKWKARQSRMVKAKTDPKVMRERAEALWRDPDMRAHLSEKTRERTNGKEHQAYMVEHNKKIWSDPDFRKRHSERTKKTLQEKWADPAYREKISALTTAANKKRWADPEFKRRTSLRIRIALAQPLNKKRQSKVSRELAQRPEARARSSQLMKERWEDPEYRARMIEQISATATKRWREDPVYRAKKVAVLVKAVRSPEGRARMSKFNKERWADPEFIAKQKARWTPEARAAQSERNAKRWADPKFKARVSKAISKARRKKPEQT